MKPPASDPRNLVPHRPPILCIDRVLAVDETIARAEGLVREGPGARDGLLWELCLIEGMAQTAALMLGHLQQGKNGRPRIGFLVGLKHLRIHRRPALGELVQYQILPKKRIAPMSMVAGEARVGGELIAEGQLKFYVEERPEQEGSR